jgi:hypothetical protein
MGTLFAERTLPQRLDKASTYDRVRLSPPFSQIRELSRLTETGTFATVFSQPRECALGSGVVVARVQQTNQEEGRSMIDVTGVKVFSATKAKERELLGELITDWIRSHPEHEIVDKIVTQSSDSEFHCLTITLFYKHNGKH